MREVSHDQQQHQNGDMNENEQMTKTNERISQHGNPFHRSETTFVIRGDQEPLSPPPKISHNQFPPIKQNGYLKNEIITYPLNPPLLLNHIPL
jgi:hypothetical protein